MSEEEVRCRCGHVRSSHSPDGICLIDDGPDDPWSCLCLQFRPFDHRPPTDPGETE